jgi:GT2 family glycosyltransferase
VPEQPRTTVVVVTWRGRELIGRCLDALDAQTRPHRVLVVDNASTDGTAGLLANRHGHTVRLARNVGYAGALAAVLPSIDTPFMAWLNDDAEPEPDWLAELESTVDSRPDVAAAGSVLLSHDGAVQSAGVRLTPLGYGADVQTKPQADDPVFGFCGGAALLRTGVLRAIGGVPAEFFCYYEDTDTSWRLRLAGHAIVTNPRARVRHRHGASTRPGSRQFHRWNERNRLLMLVRCAPAWVAARELARFAVITAALPLRAPRRTRPDAANFSPILRLRVLAELAVALPGALRARRAIGRRAAVARGEVWRRWTGAEPAPARTAS